MKRPEPTIPPMAPETPIPPARILVVEDEPRLARLVADYLVAAGHAARTLGDGREVMEAVRAWRPDLVVLDLMLPGLDGLSVCRELRRTGDLPVLMLTARIEEADRLAGLDAGADDYVCKPFSPREVVARVQAILRRSRRPAATAPPAPASPLEIDEAAYRARLQGRELDLTPVEFRLLAALASAPGRAYSRDQLLDRLHHDGRALNDRTVDSHIRNLRRKLEQARPGADPIRSIYGVGYRLELD